MPPSPPSRRSAPGSGAGGAGGGGDDTAGTSPVGTSMGGGNDVLGATSRRHCRHELHLLDNRAAAASTVVSSTGGSSAVTGAEPMHQTNSGQQGSSQSHGVSGSVASGANGGLQVQTLELSEGENFLLLQNKDVEDVGAARPTLSISCDPTTGNADGSGLLLLVDVDGQYMAIKDVRSLIAAKPSRADQDGNNDALMDKVETDGAKYPAAARAEMFLTRRRRRHRGAATSGNALAPSLFQSQQSQSQPKHQSQPKQQQQPVFSSSTHSTSAAGVGGSGGDCVGNGAVPSRATAHSTEHKEDAALKGKDDGYDTDDENDDFDGSGGTPGRSRSQQKTYGEGGEELQQGYCPSELLSHRQLRFLHKGDRVIIRLAGERPTDTILEYRQSRMGVDPEDDETDVLMTSVDAPSNEAHSPSAAAAAVGGDNVRGGKGSPANKKRSSNRVVNFAVDGPAKSSCKGTPATAHPHGPARQLNAMQNDSDTTTTDVAVRRLIGIPIAGMGDSSGASTNAAVVVEARDGAKKATADEKEKQEKQMFPPIPSVVEMTGTATGEGGPSIGRKSAGQNLQGPQKQHYSQSPPNAASGSAGAVDGVGDDDEEMEEYSYLTGEVIMKDQGYVSAITGDDETDVEGSAIANRKRSRIIEDANRALGIDKTIPNATNPVPAPEQQQKEQGKKLSQVAHIDGNPRDEKGVAKDDAATASAVVLDAGPGANNNEKKVVIKSPGGEDIDNVENTEMEMEIEQNEAERTEKKSAEAFSDAKEDIVFLTAQEVDYGDDSDATENDREMKDAKGDDMEADDEGYEEGGAMTQPYPEPPFRSSFQNGRASTPESGRSLLEDDDDDEDDDDETAGPEQDDKSVDIYEQETQPHPGGRQSDTPEKMALETQPFYASSPGSDAAKLSPALSIVEERAEEEEGEEEDDSVTTAGSAVLLGDDQGQMRPPNKPESVPTDASIPTDAAVAALSLPTSVAGGDTPKPSAKGDMNDEDSDATEDEGLQGQALLSSIAVKSSNNNNNNKNNAEDGASSEETTVCEMDVSTDINTAKNAVAEAEAKRIAEEKAAAEKAAAEAEAKRIAAEKAAAEKAAAEEAEAKRVAEEKEAAERAAAKEAEAKRVAEEKAAAEKAAVEAEAKRIAGEKEAAERAAAKEAEAKRVAEEKAAAEKAAAEAEAKRIAAEKKAAERAAAKEAEAKRVAEEKAAAEKAAVEAEAKRIAGEKEAAERAAAKEAEAKRVAEEKAAAEKAAVEAEAKRIAGEKKAAERAAAEEAEAKRVAEEKAAAEKAAAEAEAKRIAGEKKAAERAAAKEAEAKRVAEEKAAAEKAAAEAEARRIAEEKAAAEKAAEEAEAKRVAEEKSAAEKAEAKRVAEEKAAIEAEAKRIAEEKEATEKSAAESETVRVIFTGINVTAKHRKMIESIGGDLIEGIEEAVNATHVIAGDGKTPLRRTPKLMICICKTSNILNLKWLTDSAKAKKPLDPEKFLLLNDKAAEKSYSFSMRKSLRNGDDVRSKRGGLLGSFYVHFCKGVAGKKAPPAEELDLIVDAAGGTILKSISVKATKEIDPTQVVLITSDPPTAAQNSEVKRLSALGAKVFPTSWLFHCIITQNLGEIDDENDDSDNDAKTPASSSRKRKAAPESGGRESRRRRR